MVGAAGFEPATPWSQARCATKLRYAPLLKLYEWQGQKDLNPQPTILETATLPIELYPYMFGTSFKSMALALIR